MYCIRTFVPPPSLERPRGHSVFGSVRLWVSLWVCASRKRWEHHISKNQWRQLHPFLVAGVFEIADVLIRFWRQAGKVGVTVGNNRKTPWKQHLHRIHRLHRRQHARDDAGMSKHRLSPYNAYYHNWHTLNFTASDSSSDERCFLKVLILLQLTQLAGSIFQLSITLKTFFLTSSLNLFLNTFW